MSTSSSVSPTPTSTATSTATSVLRRFNRTYTQRIGVLDDSFLGLGIPLGAARLLFEIGVDGVTARELRTRLGLDSGYLSRLLRGLEQRGLVSSEQDPADRRLRRLTLTGAGRATHAELEQRSEDLAQRLVDPLTPRQRDRLVEALSTADLLVRAATVQLVEVDGGHAAAVESFERYRAEVEARFAPLYPDGFDGGPPSRLDVLLVATSDGAPAACGGLHDLGPGVTEIKRMWVDPAWRGAGLGARLLRELEQRAIARGRLVVRLDSNAVLTEAVALYERHGYHPIERYNDNPYPDLFFEKRLTAPQ